MSQATDSLIAADVGRATLTSQIAALVARVHPNVDLERRHDDRIAIPVLFRLTPFDADHQPIDNQHSIVVGKNISRRGLSFYHERSIPHRRALIELAHPGLGSFAAEIDLSWCRFTRPGWYESGGRLVRSLTQNLPLPGCSVPHWAIPTGVLPAAVGEHLVSRDCRL